MISNQSRTGNQNLNEVRKDFTKSYYDRIHRAKAEGRPIAYTTALGPTEILSSMGVELACRDLCDHLLRQTAGKGLLRGG